MKKSTKFTKEFERYINAVGNLTGLPGVGHSEAKKLYEEKGYEKISDLYGISYEELAATPRIGNALAARIVAFVEKHEKENRVSFVDEDTMFVK